MGRTKRTQVALYLDADKVEALKRLAKDTGLTQQELLRHGVDLALAVGEDLVAKHKAHKRSKKRRPTSR